MKEKFPDYAPLTFDFDQNRMFEELNQLQSHFMGIGLPEEFYHDLYPTEAAHLWDKIMPRSAYFEILRHKVNCHGEMELLPYSIPSFRLIGLTFLEGEPHSLTGSPRLRGHRLGEWQWRKDLHYPYTQSVIQRLPFKSIDTIRVLQIPKGGYGPLHYDSVNRNYFEQNGCLSLSLVAHSGGTHMWIFDPPNHICSSAKASIFDDYFLHGTGKTKSDRIVVRVNGEPLPEMWDMIDEKHSLKLDPQFKYRVMVPE